MPDLEIKPAEWIAAGLVGCVLFGGVVSVGVQHFQSSSRLKGAAEAMTGGDVQRGQEVVVRAQCGACHEIPGIDRAYGTSGPSLDGIATKPFIAGRLANTPANMVRWVGHPQTIAPGAAMPDPPISAQEARDVAAYLYTLK